MKQFSIRLAFIEGYRDVIRNLGLFLLAYGIRGALWFVGIMTMVGVVGSKALLSQETSDLFPPIAFSLPSIEQLQSAELYTLLMSGIMFLVLQVLDSFLMLGLTKMAISITKKNKATISQLWSSSFHMFFHMAILTFVYSLLVFFGTLFFIIPGLLVATAYSLSFIYLIDRDAKPLESLTASRALTKSALLKMIAFYILSAVINFIGMIPFGLGTLFTGPLTLCAQVSVYLTLSKARS
jgi:uncharacterized membrane protein